MKKFWLIFGGISIFVAMIVAIFLTTVFTKPKDEIIDDNPPVVTLPNISANNISLYTNQTKDIVYTVEFDGEYTTSFLCNFDQVEIANNKICALESGEYYFDIVVSIDQRDYTKRVNVFVYDPITQIDCKFYDENNNIVDKVFVGKNYALKIIPNSIMLDNNFSYPTNVSELNNQTSENGIFISFKIERYGQTTFKYWSFEFFQEISIDTYCIIDDFNVSITHTSLYLFNTEYILQANNDGIFNESSFDFSLDEKNYNSYQIQVSNQEVIQIVDNKIIAKGCGNSYIRFVASDGSDYTEQYLITVQNVLIDEMSFGEQNVELEVNESYTPQYIISPIYSICNLEYNMDFENSISFSSAGNFILTLTDKLSQKSCDMTIIVSEVEIINYQLHFNNSFLTEYNATFENDTLTLTGKDTNVIYFDYLIISTPQYTGSIISTFQIIGDEFDYDLQINSNVVTLTTSYKGNFSLKLTLNQNPNCTYILNIVIQ